MDVRTTIARRWAAGLLSFVALGAGAAHAQVALKVFRGEPNGKVANEFGYSAVAIGDINGDSVTDFVIGAPWYSPFVCGDARMGYVSVVSGKDGALLKQHIGTYWTCGVGSYLGVSVARAGDLNGDGVPDYWVGAPGDIPNGPVSGAVRLYSGKDHTQIGNLTGNAANDYFGWRMSAGGDVDMDGVQDVFIASYEDQPFKTDCGSVRIVSGATLAIIHTVYGGTPGAQMDACDRVGDVNLDGHDDILTGAHFENSGPYLKNGRVRVFSGKHATQGQDVVLLQFDGSASDEELGWRVAGAGDLNMDGYPDLLAVSKNPRVVHVRDSFGGVLAVIPAPANSVAFGDSIAGVGDVDGDGRGDFVVGDPGFGGAAGIVYTFSLLPNQTPPWEQFDETMPVNGDPNARFGFSVTGAGYWETTGTSGGQWADGDCNADGLADVVIGATYDYFGRGSAWVYAPVCLEAQTYCTSANNSSGKPAKIGYQGSLSLVADDFVLTAQDCPASKFGLFYYGTLPLPAVPFPCGFRCVGGTTYRFGVLNTGASGSVAYPVDYANPPAMGTLIPGSTWNFQFWFRDPGACANGNVNFSDALSGTFCP
jgi:hypothetical protein